jgi:hypothetical protein
MRSEIRNSVEPATVGIDDHVYDVLNVFGFVLGPEAHLFERIVLDARAGGVGRIELQADVARAFPPACGERPIFAFEIVNQRGMRSREKCRYDDSGAFSAASRSKDQHVAGAGIAEEANARVTLPASQIDSSAMRSRSNAPEMTTQTPNNRALRQESGSSQVAVRGPAGGTVKIGAPSEHVAAHDCDDVDGGRRDQRHWVDGGTQARDPNRPKLWN